MGFLLLVMCIWVSCASVAWLVISLEHWILLPCLYRLQFLYPSTYREAFLWLLNWALMNKPDRERPTCRLCHGRTFLGPLDNYYHTAYLLGCMVRAARPPQRLYHFIFPLATNECSNLTLLHIQCGSCSGFCILVYVCGTWLWAQGPLQEFSASNSSVTLESVSFSGACPLRFLSCLKC